LLDVFHFSPPRNLPPPLNVSQHATPANHRLPLVAVTQ